MPTTWMILDGFLEAHVLPEEKMYRGESSVRMKDLRSLFDRLRDDGQGHASTDDPKVLQGDPNPDGDFINCKYSVHPEVWSKWGRAPEFAKIIGSTDKGTQYPGAPYGGTVMKRNYGGKVVYQPGPPEKSPDKYASSMDRYDVLMVGDVTGGAIPKGASVDLKAVGKRSNKNPAGADIVVRRIVWSPAIGSFEERKARLEALMSGRQGPELSRRPQPELPEPEKAAAVPPPKPAMRQGQNVGSPSSGLASLSAKKTGVPYKQAPWYKKGGAAGGSLRRSDDDDDEYGDKDR